jgi:hypothetical protein
MFNLFKKLLKHKPEDKNEVRKVSEDEKSMKKQTKLGSKKREKGEPKMPNEKEKVEDIKENEKVEETKDGKVDEEKKETVEKDKAVDKVSEDTETKNAESAEKEEEKAQEPIVETTDEENINAIPVNELVTKEDLTARLSAFEAKLDAVIKENQDLKDKLAQSQQDANDLRDKYENKDFGTLSKKGVAERDKSAENTFGETFESYSKRFM